MGVQGGSADSGEVMRQWKDFINTLNMPGLISCQAVVKKSTSCISLSIVTPGGHRSY